MEIVRELFFIQIFVMGLRISMISRTIYVLYFEISLLQTLVLILLSSSNYTLMKFFLQTI